MILLLSHSRTPPPAPVGANFGVRGACSRFPPCLAGMRGAGFKTGPPDGRPTASSAFPEGWERKREQAPRTPKLAPMPPTPLPASGQGRRPPSALVSPLSQPLGEGPGERAV